MRYLWVALALVGCLGRDDDEGVRNPCAVVLPCLDQATVIAHTALTADQLVGATITVCEDSRCASAVLDACVDQGCRLMGDVAASVASYHPGELYINALPAQTRMDEMWSVEIFDASNTPVFAASAIGSYVADVYPCGTCRALTLDLQ